MTLSLAEKIYDPATVWQKIQEIIKENINVRSYNTWFAPTEAITIEDEYLEILVPNRFFCEWIENHYSKLVQNAIAQILGESKRIKYLVRNENSKPSSPYQPNDWQPAPAPVSPYIMPSQPVNSPYYTKINERYVFDSFVVGDSNNFAYAAARAVADSPGKTNYNPLIVYGGTGLGKTHLVQAIGNHARFKYPNTKVYYASSETFTSHFINSIQQNKVAEFSAFYRSCDILLLDDIHFFSNKGKTQEEFFHTFNDLHQNGKQIILTSDRPINELTALEERLISRFKWGLIVDIQPPDFETRLAILRKKCDDSNLMIPGDILEYLAVNLMDNVRELEGALTKLLARVTFTAAEPSLDMARSIVAEIARPDVSVLTIDKIMEHVAKVFNLPIDQLRAKTRKKDVVIARQIAMYLSKQLTRHSLVTIGLHFGGRDHSTVIHGLDIIENRLKEDVVFRQKLDNMKKHLEYNRN
ncbi:MAG: chromosomal replication initiator protein DnaA [Calditrichaceae bacterium]|nr:chromosomal replication initiator protein DnaA [Calditrichaceae bacterium]MBN2710387.1 chromosomal replication initiator protein DnaA [Calditrichaceae bacterium]RQV92891.1 MAG: chromosomal replication initiator protein DnaA [Calditrichota bacterium]